MIVQRKFTGSEEPSVCYCEREYDLTPGAVFGPVIRDVYIVEFCVEGYGSVVINGREFEVSPRKCYILLPGDTVMHTADKRDPRRGVWFGVDSITMGRYLKRAGITSENPFAPDELFDELYSWGEKMLEYWRGDSVGDSLFLTSCVYGFLATLLKEKKEFSSDEWVERVTGIMSTRYNEQIKVSDIATAVGLERAYFSSLFQKRVGTSPYKYLTSIRIRHACTLIENGYFNISQVANAVGLDSRNFSRLFKKETGTTPNEYKKKMP